MSEINNKLKVYADRDYMLEPLIIKATLQQAINFATVVVFCLAIAGGVVFSIFPETMDTPIIVFLQRWVEHILASS